MLFPGDKIFTPYQETKQVSVPTDDRHKFQLFTDPLSLRIKLERGYNQPLAGKPCRLAVELDKFDLTSDGSGLIEHKIGKTAVSASLTVKETVLVHGKELPLDWEIDLKIAYLDPVEETSGQQARLANLGYGTTAVRPALSMSRSSYPPPKNFHASTVWRSTASSARGPRAKLREVHGS
ncbi:MAG: hypothetical protein ACR2I2_05725 [Bryobacteraceae bacterium]